MKLIVMVMSLILVSISSWAGTFKDNFEDGNWTGWVVLASEPWNENVGDRLSIVEGILRMDAMNKLEKGLNLCMMKDWKDYSLSVDMRIVQVEPGGE